MILINTINCGGGKHIDHVIKDNKTVVAYWDARTIFLKGREPHINILDASNL